MPSHLQPQLPESASLQRYAIIGDDTGVASALESGADVNALDASGRTALMCAIAGEHWNDINVSHSSFMSDSRLRTIQSLLDCHDVSLFTLNAPQSSFNDATPLGMAAWLNMPEAVRVLLEGSSDAVSVDGMDPHGATPLMYAARDGSLEVVKLLLSHGARPDFRDRNYRSTIQYALTHPQILYLCEAALRRHRLRENETSRAFTAESSQETESLNQFDEVQLDQEAISKTTHAIIQLTLSSDISSLHSFLFSSSASLPYSQAKKSILVNLPNAKGWSPIHYCAQMQFPSIEILDILHFAGADTSLFTTEEHWTVLHCLAVSYCTPDKTSETEHSLRKFVAHLICDLRAPFSAKDKEDETCIHLAAERGQSLELLKVLLEFDRSKSIQNVRNSRGLTAQEVARPEFLGLFGVDIENDRPESSLSMATVRPVKSASSLSSSASSWKPSSIYSRREASDNDSIVCSDDFDVVAAAHQLIDNLRITSPFIHHSIAFSHLEHLENVLRETEVLHSAIIQFFRSRSKGSSKALENMNSDAKNISGLLNNVTAAVSSKLVDHGLPPIHPKKAVRESEDSQITAVSVTSLISPPPPPPIPSSVDVKVKSSPTKSLKDDSKFASKFMGWFKRKPSSETKDETKETIQESTPSDQVTGPSVQPAVVVVDKALQTSRIVLAAATRDMSVIHESLASATELMKSASRSIARADRIIKGAIKSRHTMLADLRATGRKEADELFVHGTPGALGYSNYLAQKPSIQSIDSVSSVGSVTSNLSFSGIMADNDDEEIKAIRRLILRKIEARHDGALDEMDKVVGWLQVIKETVRGVKRRTYCK